MGFDFSKTFLRADGSLKTPSTQSVIALLFAGVSSYLWIAMGEIPDSLASVTFVIIGFFFGDRRTGNTTTEPVAPPLVGTPT